MHLFSNIFYVRLVEFADEKATDKSVDCWPMHVESLRGRGSLGVSTILEEKNLKDYDMAQEEDRTLAL